MIKKKMEIQKVEMKIEDLGIGMVMSIKRWRQRRC